MVKTNQEKIERARQKAYESKQRSFERMVARRKAKMESTLTAAIRKVKEEARQDCWCTIHDSCFRYYEGETDNHVRAKFERFLHWRKYGASVFTELILKNGKRPDLIICLNNGEVFIEEILESEKEENILLNKKEAYPFKIYSFKAIDIIK